MNIAIVRCKKSADKNCIGSCLETYANGAHPGEIPAYYFHCGGCESSPITNEDILAKIERLKANNITKIHFSSCIHEGCPNLEDLEKLFKDNGMETEFAYLSVK